VRGCGAGAAIYNGALGRADGINGETYGCSAPYPAARVRPAEAGEAAVFKSFERLHGFELPRHRSSCGPTIISARSISSATSPERQGSATDGGTMDRLGSKSSPSRSCARAIAIRSTLRIRRGGRDAFCRMAHSNSTAMSCVATRRCANTLRRTRACCGLYDATLDRIRRALPRCRVGLDLLRQQDISGHDSGCLA
jgi:hypothetical protein